MAHIYVATCHGTSHAHSHKHAHTHVHTHKHTNTVPHACACSHPYCDTHAHTNHDSHTDQIHTRTHDDSHTDRLSVTAHIMQLPQPQLMTGKRHQALLFQGRLCVGSCGRVHCVYVSYCVREIMNQLIVGCASCWPDTAIILVLSYY